MGPGPSPFSYTDPPGYMDCLPCWGLALKVNDDATELLMTLSGLVDILEGAEVVMNL
jgi:hypothetical protein